MARAPEAEVKTLENLVILRFGWVNVFSNCTPVETLSQLLRLVRENENGQWLDMAMLLAIANLNPQQQYLTLYHSRTW